MEHELELKMLHALRLKGFAEEALVATLAGMGLESTVAALSSLQANQMVRFRDGALVGWALTERGRSRGEQLLAEELDHAEARLPVTEIYRRFLAHNQPFLELCARWQIRSVNGAHVPNDHTDQSYDAEVLASLDAIHDAMEAICSDLADQLERFSGYRARFDWAVEQIHRGKLDWFTKPLIDSYHTVWFELHEDMLATLGKKRGRENQL